LKTVKYAKIIIVIILIFSVCACSNKALVDVSPEHTPVSQAQQTDFITNPPLKVTETTETSMDRPLLDEMGVVSLRLPENIQAPSFEYSGMAWFGDHLVLLPQYPEGKDFSRESYLFAIAKEDLLLAIENPEFELPVKDVPILNSDLRSVIRGFEGFESILFVDQDVYLTVESHGGNPMMGYLMRGEVEGELESIRLDPESLVELEPLSSADNATFEAMTFWNGNLYVLYEHNSKQVGEQPIAYQYSLDLVFEREIAFPVIDFRITDATTSDLSGKFWVVNYFFPGDTHLAVEHDHLLSQYGEGETHAVYEPVERLVQLQIESDQISRIDQAPIYLQLLDKNIARNWEGIILLEDLGFLLISDSFPGSILGFCPILR